MKSMPISAPGRMNPIGALLPLRARASVAVRSREFLWNSYVRLAASRSISYGSIAFYAGKEAVMPGLLAALAGLVLMATFVAYEVLRGRI